MAHETAVHQQAEDLSQLKHERNQAQRDFAGMIEAAEAVEAVFRDGYGRAESVVMASLTQPMRRALHRLQVAKNSRTNGRGPASTIAYVASKTQGPS